MHICLTVLIIVSIIKINAQDYVYYPNIGVFYKYHQNPSLWNDARKLCRSENATMALPRNENDVQTMLNIFASTTEFVYIGLHRFFQWHEYLTLKGKSMQYYYNLWDDTEPNGADDESCIGLKRNGKLHDFFCRDKNPFICQKNTIEDELDFAITHNNPYCASNDSEYRYFQGIEKCYKIHMNARVWSDARVVCEAEGSHLAVIKEKAEEEFIAAMFKEPKYTARHTTHPSLALVGVHELFEKGKYMTVLDEELSSIYNNWLPSKPAISEKQCVAIDKDGRLNDIPCNVYAFYICEQPSKKNLNNLQNIQEANGALNLKPDKKFRKDYTFLSKYEAFYKVHYIKQKYSGAVTTCMAEGGELLLPSSKEEVQDVFKISKITVLQFYVGIHDRLSEGSFITLDGISIDEVYYSWAAGEPNNQNDNEDCVLAIRDGSYIDDDCSSRQHFVCKKDLKTVTENPICETYDKDYFYEVTLDKCYKMHTFPRTWSEAFRICKAEESDLVIINSDFEAEMLTKEFENHPTYSLIGNFRKDIMHIGFHDMFNEGVHYTIEGKLLSESGYEKWGKYQPDNDKGREGCGSMFRDGTLNDIGCEVRALFACEKKLSQSVNQTTIPKTVKSVQNIAENDTNILIKLPDA